MQAPPLASSEQTVLTPFELCRRPLLGPRPTLHPVEEEPGGAASALKLVVTEEVRAVSSLCDGQGRSLRLQHHDLGVASALRQVVGRVADLAVDVAPDRLVCRRRWLCRRLLRLRRCLTSGGLGRRVGLRLSSHRRPPWMAGEKEKSPGGLPGLAREVGDLSVLLGLLAVQPFDRPVRGCGGCEDGLLVAPRDFEPVRDVVRFRADLRDGPQGGERLNVSAALQTTEVLRHPKWLDAAIAGSASLPTKSASITLAPPQKGMHITTCDRTSNFSFEWRTSFLLQWQYSSPAGQIR